jgi:hypothetical protein
VPVAAEVTICPSCKTRGSFAGKNDHLITASAKFVIRDTFLPFTDKSVSYVTRTLPSGFLTVVPPINLFDFKLAYYFYIFLESLSRIADTSDTKAVIFSSANSEYFLGHIDIQTLSVASPERK